MKNRKYNLKFEFSASFAVIEKAEATLSDGTKIIFFPTEDVSIPNLYKNFGEIYYEVNKPDLIDDRSEGEQKLKSFLTCLSVKKNFENIESIRFKEFELINKEDFEKIPPYKGKMKVTFNILVNGIPSMKLEKNDVDEIIGMLETILKLPQEERNKINRSMLWFVRANETQKEIDKFLFRWISYEALLGVLNRKNSTPKLSTMMINETLPINTARKILSSHNKLITSLSEANLVSYQGTEYSKNLKSALAGENAKVILQKAILCIYEVRNSLFHRAEVHNLIEGCDLLLKDVIKDCLNDRFLT